MLTLVSTPIGNLKDITVRALETLKKADLIICEERRVGETFLKKNEIHDKDLFELNEHSTPQDLRSLFEMVKSKNVALISDCGTPGFCDPGADLVALCYKEKIEVNINPGASSLMALLSLTGIQIKDFYFAGFLPQESGERQRRIEKIKTLNTDFVVMDTPYRLNKTLEELSVLFPKNEVVVGLDLTGQSHRVLRGKLSGLIQEKYPKLPFVIYVKI